ncbi:MAG TPA: tetratricopeptide repeat protein [Gemmatimonadaceae bacterium]|nr:tetratricopeptide repeat protein [Gemmatimonadaceae bacterium]
MSNVDKLKKKAAEFEQKKQFDKALEVYLQIIGATEGQDDRDVTVYNRVGDLYLRLNKADQAVNYYEQAVDLYTDGGYLNNAIALCNKILRHAPSRHQIYYKLGKISAKKGFNSDAKKNFLEYADRMHRAGKDGDAFKALQEFADLCPGQDDIRLMLADQLARAGKSAEAIEQLQILHESLDAEGRTAEAEATVERMHTLDPAVEPRRSKTPRQKEAGGLVFLDVGGSPPKPRPKMEDRKAPLAPHQPRPLTPEHVQPLPEFEQLPDIETMTPITPVEGLELQPESIADVEPAFDLSITDVNVSPLEGLESAADPEAFAIDPEVGSSPLEGLVSDETVHEPGLGEPLSDEDPLAGLSVLSDDSFYANDDGPLSAPKAPAAHSAPVQAEPEHDFPDIEPLDLHIEDPAPASEAQLDQQFQRDREAVREREPEVEPEPEPYEEPAPAPAPRVAHRTPPRKEPEPVEEVEEEEEEEEQPQVASRAAPPEPPKPTRPKLVEPLRMTRPKPKVEKAKEKEPEPEAATPGERRPMNPFQRQRAKGKNSGPKGAPRVATPPTEVPRAATPKENPPHRVDDHFVDLGDWLREQSGPRSYRMVAEEDQNREEGTEADFTYMLEKFKAGVAANVDDEDFDSHYDLGVAYREMGLFDEAIFEFQKALRGATQRIRAYEALGQCFIDRGEHDVAITVLGRALREPGMEDEDLIGVLYLLGFASEGSRKPRDAAAYYQRVFAIDIDFRDVSKRLKQMAKAASK